MKDLVETIHPGTIAGMRTAEQEIVAEHRRMDEAIGWLLTNYDNPLVDPNHRLGYEERVERTLRKLEGSDG